MRGLVRMFVAAFALVALVGCSAGGQTKAPSWCVQWEETEVGGYCKKSAEEATWEALDDYASRTNPNYGLTRSKSNGSNAGSVFDQPSVYRGRDLDCEDFGSRADAQAYLEANPADADYLDGDGDGIACEWGT